MTAARRRARLTLLALLVCLTVATLVVAPAGARSTAGPPGPALGDWEGTAAGGVPLSFALARDPGGIRVNALVVGFPAGCPVGPRHTLVAPVDRPSLVASSSPAPGSILITGMVAGNQVNLRGQLNGSRSATLSTDSANQQLPCSWPKTLTWPVRPARRMVVADATWGAKVSGVGLGGTVTVSTVGGGRVVTSFQAHYTCMGSDGISGEGTIGSTPANEFISPNGSFASPADLQVSHKVPVRWAASFGAHGSLRGSFTDDSPCTGKPVHASFAAARPLPG